MICLTPSIVYKKAGKYFLTFVLKVSALEGRVHPSPPLSKNKKTRFHPTPHSPHVGKPKNMPNPPPPRPCPHQHY